MSLENLSPSVTKLIHKEIQGLIKSPIEGIHLLPNDSDVSELQCLLKGPQSTPYEQGCFRIRLIFTDEFPNAPPKGYFLTKIFHPNIAKNGEICVNTLKKDWKKEMGLSHILLTVKCLLIHPNPESALNEEAGRLLLECYDDYYKHAQLITSLYGQTEMKLFQDHHPSSLLLSLPLSKETASKHPPSENVHSETQEEDSTHSSQLNAKKILLDAKKRTLKRL